MVHDHNTNDSQEHLLANYGVKDTDDTLDDSGNPVLAQGVRGQRRMSDSTN